MQLSAFDTLGTDVGQSLERAIAYESAGIDVIGVAEAYGIDGVSLLGYLAAKTTRVRLMSEILPIYSRTPTLTAMTAAGLDFVSGGRFVLGLGAIPRTPRLQTWLQNDRWASLVDQGMPRSGGVRRQGLNPEPAD